jgi:hypothetical protein
VETRENRTLRDRDLQIGGNISISVTNNEGNANIANEQPQNFLINSNFLLLYNENSEQGANENSNSAPPPNKHPLLSGRPDGTSTDRVDYCLHVNDGLQTARRSNHTRRYQFINISSRNQPIIIQRMLELRQSRQAGQNASGANDLLLLRDGTRVVVMDNGFGIFLSSDELDFEMVDNSGY